MPEHIRSLIVILGLAALIFFYLRDPAAEIVGARSFTYRRNLWIAITLFAFLSHNFWIYVFLAWLAITLTSRTDAAKVSIFLFLLFAVPGESSKIPGLGLINYLFELNHQRLLVISLLLPAFLKLVLSGGRKSSGNKFVDRLLILYVLLTIVLYFRGTTFTDTLRFALEQFLDIYVPYYVVAYSIRNIGDFKDTMFSYVTVVLILSLIGVFEIARHWHLYTALAYELNIAPPHDSYLGRAGLLRASASLHRIPLGYVIAIGLGFHLFLRPYFPSRRAWTICLAVLLAGLISPLSRGPWVGAIALFFTATFFSDKKKGAFFNFLTASAVFIIVISLTPLASTLSGLIPFVGDIESGNIDYRERLMTNSWIVIQRNFWFGSIDYLSTPEMMALIQGQGIIDVVNSYIAVALKYGIVGLALYGGVFVITAWKVYRQFCSYRQLDAEKNKLGLILFSTLICIMIVIFTVSSVSAIPIMYWVTLGLCSAYLNFPAVKAIESGDNNSLSNIQKKSVSYHSTPR